PRTIRVSLMCADIGTSYKGQVDGVTRQPKIGQSSNSAVKLNFEVQSTGKPIPNLASSIKIDNRSASDAYEEQLRHHPIIAGRRAAVCEHPNSWATRGARANTRSCFVGAPTSLIFR